VAVARFKLTKADLVDLAGRAAQMGQTRAARELNRAVDRSSKQAELTGDEVRALLAGVLTLGQLHVLRRAERQVRAAEAFEAERSTRLRDKLTQRRAQLDELARKETK
jgi:hypothetical protein